MNRYSITAGALIGCMALTTSVPASAVPQSTPLRCGNAWGQVIPAMGIPEFRALNVRASPDVGCTEALSVARTHVRGGKRVMYQGRRTALIQVGRWWYCKTRVKPQPTRFVYVDGKPHVRYPYRCKQFEFGDGKVKIRYSKYTLVWDW